MVPAFAAVGQAMILGVLVLHLPPYLGIAVLSASAALLAGTLSDLSRR